MQIVAVAGDARSGENEEGLRFDCISATLQAFATRRLVYAHHVVQVRTNQRASQIGWDSVLDCDSQTANQLIGTAFR